MEEIYSDWKNKQINDHLFKDTYKSNNIKICMNDMMVNHSENECEMKKNMLGQYRRYQSWDSLYEYRLRRKGRVKEMSFQFLKEKRG